MTHDYHNAPHIMLRAGHEDRWIGVHELSEYVFCPLAGAIAIEQERDDDGEENTKRALLGYTPLYIPEEIDAALERTWHQIILLLVALVVTPVATIVLIWSVDHRLVWLGTGMMLYVVWRIVVRSWQYLKLAHSRRQARRASPRRPIEGLREKQVVNWWELLQSGFAAKRFREPFREPEWKLAGRPFHVLLDGSLKIPVIRVNNHEKKVHRNHIARIAAYCQLIEACLGGKSPYGIVLFGRTYEGFAVANQQDARNVFYDGLVQIRELARRDETEFLLLDPPENLSVCSGCPYGFPYPWPFRKQEHRRFGELLPVFRAVSARHVFCHSHCGDRFRWVPAHKKAQELGLEPADSVRSGHTSRHAWRNRS